MNKIFSLGTILTVTTGRLLTKPKSESDNGISALYEILAFMTGDVPFTHSLARFADECTPFLIEKIPELKNADISELDKMIKNKTDTTMDICSWLERCVNEWGMSSEYSISTIPQKNHKTKDPLTELESMITL